MKYGARRSPLEITCVGKTDAVNRELVSNKELVSKKKVKIFDDRQQTSAIHCGMILTLSRIVQPEKSYVTDITRT
jgi:hypothetical protein